MGSQSESERRNSADRVTQIFGSLGLSSRFRMEDAKLVDEKEIIAFRIEKLDHVALDEFTAGAYGSSKFDRDCDAGRLLPFSDTS